MFLNDLDGFLKQSDNVGVQLQQFLLTVLLFADDMVLLSPSRRGLQALIDICLNYCGRFCLDFNIQKSKVMIIGPDLAEGEFCPLFLNDSSFDYVTEYKYLGVTVSGGKTISFSAKYDIRSFHRASNAILRSGIRPSEGVLMNLLYSNCVPILSYACAVKEYSASDMSSCNTAINNAIRHIFSYKRYESVRHLRESLHFKSIYEIFHLARSKFSKSALNLPNDIVRHIANYFKVD